VLVDNASTDDTVAIVRQHYPEVRLIETGRNLGFGVGNNLGIALALRESARYVLLLNQDAYLPPASLNHLVEFMERHPQIDICSPLHCSPDADHLDAKTFHNYLTRPGLSYLKDAALGRVAEYYELPGVNAAIWLSRADVFRQVGGFDPIFFMYSEDDDLLNRFAYHKRRFALVPAVRGVHLRQSPPSPSAGRWTAFQKRAKRKQAQMTLFIKDPKNSTYRSLAQLLSRGLLSPLAAFVVDHDLDALVVSFAAAIRTLLSWRILMSRKRLCRVAGPHFLETDRGS